MTIREAGKPDFVVRTPSSIKFKTWLHLGSIMKSVVPGLSTTVSIYINGEIGAFKTGDFEYRDAPENVHYIGGRPLGGVVSKSYVGGMRGLEILNDAVENFDHFLVYDGCIGGCVVCGLDLQCPATCCPN